MQNNRSLFQVLWGYLSPVSQRRIRMTCKTFHGWSLDWPRTTPNLEELLDVKKWQEWVLEVGKFLNWRWAINGVVFLEVAFTRTDNNVPLLYSISVRYRTHDQPNYSSANIRYTGEGQNYGTHPGNFTEENEHTKLFIKWRSLLLNWKGNRKVRAKLFPYCSHCFGRIPRIPEKLTWTKLVYWGDRAKSRWLFACDICIKNNPEIQKERSN